MPPSRLAAAERAEFGFEIESSSAPPVTASRDDVVNELLLALPEAELEKVLAVAERVPLRPRQVLVESSLPVLYCYFIEDGMASVLAGDGTRKPMEVCLVGRRGFIGIPVVLGTGSSSLRCMVQIKGHAWRVASADIEQLIAECPSLQRVLYAHVQGRLTQEALLNVCNASHTVTERVCRWLMMARDRIRADQIPATHDLIARMIGVRRPGVTAALGELEKRKIVTLARGSIDIRHPQLVERTACRCLQRIDAEYGRLIHAATRVNSVLIACIYASAATAGF